MRLRHVLYTNRQGSAAQGFRFLHLGEPSLGSADRAQVEAWLQSVSPIGSLGFATQTLRLEAGFGVGLALVSPAFGRDDSGREGRLHHLVLAQLDEGRATGNVLAAGLRQLAVFWEKNRDATLEAYVDAAARWQKIEAPSGDPGLATRLDADTFRILNLLAQPQPPAQVELGPGVDLESVADALSFLPPRLRYGVNLALQVRAPGAVQLQPGTVVPPRSAPGTWQEPLLRLAAEDPARLAELLDDWRIPSLKAFEASLSAALQAARTSPISEPQSDGDMAKEKSVPPAPPSGEIPAAEQRLRRYVDTRLDDMAKHLLREPGFYQRFKVELWGVLILVAAVLGPSLYKATPPRPAAPPTYDVPVTVATPPAKKTELWSAWVKEHPDRVKASLEDLLTTKSLPAGTLSEVQKGNAEKYLKQLPQMQSLDARDLFFADLRLLLFEYAIRKELITLGGKVEGKIDMTLGEKEYPAVELVRVAHKLGLPGAVVIRDPDFQADLVIAHLEQP